MTEVRIFLADDHAVVLEGLKALINAQTGLKVVGESRNGLGACQQAAELKVDVVVMDVSMPELSGSQATEQLKKKSPLIKVLALTFHEEKGYIRQLLAAGADGYVLKRALPEELIRAIRVVAAGGTYLDPTMAGKVVGGFIQRLPAGVGATSAALSDRETEVLRLTAAGHSNKEIASSLDLSVKTVETYRARGMEKLALKNRAELVRYALQQGWLKDG